jgi:[methyl-Co(III) methanol-specific corrinoid protein]:coenzyme M methyltransferase
MEAVERFQRVLRQQPVDRTPVVGVTSVVTTELMRQSDTRWPDAHCDPELMVRAGAAAHVVCGLESVKTPFDMTIEAEALGAEVDYGDEENLPKIRAPRYEDPAELTFGTDLFKRGRFGVALEAIRLARKTYGEAVPVISSGVGPFTLAGVLFGTETVLVWIMEAPEKVEAALQKTTQFIGRYIGEQYAAGAHLVQIGEPSASGELISPEHYRQHIAPFHRELVGGTDRPLAVHICGNITRQLHALAAVGFHGVSFDAKTDIQAARKHLKGKAALIGYLSTSTLLNEEPEVVKAAAQECIRQGVDVLNAGCAVAPLTPIANIRAMIAAGQEMRL